MAGDPDDLTDARTRGENGAFREMAERGKSADPAYAYVPRWVPTGNWRPSGFDVILWAFGIGIILMVLGMRLFGIVG